MTEDELKQIAVDVLRTVKAATAKSEQMSRHYGPAACRADQLAAILAALQRVQRLMQVERDHARTNANILAHAYEHDSRPPWPVLRDSLAYPRLPARPGVEEAPRDE